MERVGWEMKKEEKEIKDMEKLLHNPRFSEILKSYNKKDKKKGVKRKKVSKKELKYF